MKAYLNRAGFAPSFSRFADVRFIALRGVVLLCATFLFSSCALFQSDKVRIEYTLSSSAEGVLVDVFYINKRGEKITEKDVSPGWSYLFTQDDGSQLLYVRVSNVRNGSVRARIRVESEIINDVVVREGGLKGVSAWGDDSKMLLYYTMSSSLPGYALLNTPTGTDSLSAINFGEQNGDLRLGRARYTVDAGFESGITVVREETLSDSICVYARIEFEPTPGERLDLVSDESCGVNRTSVNINAKIPGYNYVP